jgi:site-specific DNA-methyltransferase (adenine-specific)
MVIVLKYFGNFQVARLTWRLLTRRMAMGLLMGTGGGGTTPLRFHGGDRWNKYLSKVEQVRRAVRPIQDGQNTATCEDDTTDTITPPQFTEQQQVSRTGGTWATKYAKKIIGWDVAPTAEYFKELFRVAKQQIIWGANYFPNMPPTRCFVVWRKLTISDKFSMAMAEYAWTSFNQNAKVFEFAPQGKKSDPRFHPTQKPVELYNWLLTNFAKEGDKILDTHLGSGSSAVACAALGYEMLGIEIDDYYFTKAYERLRRETSQLRLF